MFELAVSVDPATGDAEEMEGINAEPTRDLQVGCLTHSHFYTALHKGKLGGKFDTLHNGYSMFSIHFSFLDGRGGVIKFPKLFMILKQGRKQLAVVMIKRNEGKEDVVPFYPGVHDPAEEDRRRWPRVRADKPRQNLHLRQQASC